KSNANTIDSGMLVDDVTAAGSAEIIRPHVSCKTERSLADNSDPGIEDITGAKEARHKPLSRAMSRRVEIPQQQTRQPLGDRDHGACFRWHRNLTPMSPNTEATS